MMSFARQVKHSAAASLTVGALAVGAVLATTAPASAAAGELRVCSQGSYSTSVTMPARMSSTVLVPPGGCVTVKVGTSTKVEEIHVFGYDPSMFWITTTNFRPSKGGQVITHGTPAHAWASVPAI